MPKHLQIPESRRTGATHPVAQLVHLGVIGSSALHMRLPDAGIRILPRREEPNTIPPFSTAVASRTLLVLLSGLLTRRARLSFPKALEPRITDEKMNSPSATFALCISITLRSAARFDVPAASRTC